jgi:pyruvate, water dikinase
VASRRVEQAVATGGSMEETSLRTRPRLVPDPLTEGQVEWLPERRFSEGDAAGLWFHDLLHNNPPSTPMGASLHHWPRGSKYAAELMKLPFSRGFDYVLYQGRIYPGPIPITDEAEIRERLPVFNEKMRELLRDWPDRYQELIDEWTAMLSYLHGIKKEVLPLDKLLGVLRDAVAISKRSWELHFLGMYPEILAHNNFEVVCNKHGVPEVNQRIFLQGFETKMYEVDRGLWWLADLASELELAQIFIGSADMDELHARLRESDGGVVWLEELDHFLHRYGRRSTAALFDPYYETWIEDPHPVLFTIRTYVMMGEFDYEEHTRKIIEQRDDFIEETVNGLQKAEDREEFLQALRDAQNTYPFNEDHNFYVEQWNYSELRFAIVECGVRLQRLRIIPGEDPNDVFFLTIDELEHVLEEVIEDEFVGIAEHSRRLPPLIARRKRRWQDLHELDPPTFIGTIPDERVDDPVFIKIWGFTDDVIRGRAHPHEELNGRVEGVPGAPGVAEGIARVIEGYQGFSEVHPNDVLVAPFTTPAWTPLFSKIKAVVTDSGGALAHSAICAREYDIPAVVGTVTRGRKATQIIKTGDRIRVDGSAGVVEVLED